MRVATTPDVVTQLQKLGFTVSVESGAGACASFDDEAYRKAGATVTSDIRELWASSDIVLKVRRGDSSGSGCERSRSRPRRPGLIAFLWPAQRGPPPVAFGQGVTALAMDSVPRISRARRSMR